MKYLWTLCSILFIISACGYKVDLVLPSKTNDKSDYGPIQTGINMQPKKEQIKKNNDNTHSSQESSQK